MIFLKIIAWWFGVTIFLFAALCAKAVWAGKRELQAAGKEPARQGKLLHANSQDSPLTVSLELDCAASALPQMPQTFSDTAQTAATVSRALM